MYDGTGYSTYDDECDALGLDCEYKERDEKLKDAAEYLEKVMKHLYLNEPLDAYKFEDDLDELCMILGVKIWQSELKIQRKKPKPEFADWIHFNNNYLEKIAQ